MNPEAKKFLPEEYTLPPGTRKAFYKQKRLENLLRQKESMDRLERGDPTDAIASMKAENEFRRKEEKTREAFNRNRKGGKKCKTKKNKRKTKGKRGKKLRSKSIRKRK